MSAVALSWSTQQQRFLKQRTACGVPSTFLTLFEFTREASSLSCIFGKELYKCVLLIIGIIRAVLRLLACFFHFDLPAFDALQEMAHIYLDPDAPSNQKDRTTLERIIMQLEADNATLLERNQEMSARICSLETRARGLEDSLSQQEDTTRQLLLGILACRQTARSSDPRSHSYKLRLGIPKLLDSGQVTKEDTDETPIQDNVVPQLLVQLLMFCRSTRSMANVVTTVISASRRLEGAAQQYEDISQSLIVELLTFRKHARVLCAQNRMKNCLATKLIQKQQRELQAREIEHEMTAKQILVQTLSLRSRLSHLLLSCRSASARTTPPLSPITPMTFSVSVQSLTTQLESLRLSEAQAHAEKESLAKSLSEVLANLPSDLCGSYMGEEPIRELVLALAFTWKLLRRKPHALAQPEAIKTDKADMEAILHIRGEQMKRLRPDIPPDSVRARAFKLGPPMNKSPIPMLDSTRHRVNHSATHYAHDSIDIDLHQGHGLTHVSNFQPLFSSGIAFPSHPVRSPAQLPSHSQHVPAPLMESSLPNPIYPSQGYSLTHVSNLEPFFSPGISFPSHPVRSSAQLPPHSQHVPAPLVESSLTNPTYPSRSTIMTRGGYTFGLPNEGGFLPDDQVHHELANGYWGSLRHIQTPAPSMNVTPSGVYGVPTRPLSSTRGH